MIKHWFLYPPKSRFLPTLPWYHNLYRNLVHSFLKNYKNHINHRQISVDLPCLLCDRETTHNSYVKWRSPLRLHHMFQEILEWLQQLQRGRPDVWGGKGGRKMECCWWRVVVWWRGRVAILILDLSHNTHTSTDPIGQCSPGVSLFLINRKLNL